MSTRKACGTKGAGLCDACIKSLGTGSAVTVCGNGNSDCYEFDVATADTECVSWNVTDLDDVGVGGELAGPGRLQPLLTVDPAVCNGLECLDDPDFFNPAYPGIGGGLFLPQDRRVNIIDEVSLGGSVQGTDLSPINIQYCNPSNCTNSVLILWYISESARFSQGIPAGPFRAEMSMTIDDNGQTGFPINNVPGPSRVVEVTAGPAHLRQIRTGAIVRTVTRIIPPLTCYRIYLAKNVSTSLPVGITESGANRARGVIISGVPR